MLHASVNFLNKCFAEFNEMVVVVGATSSRHF